MQDSLNWLTGVEVGRIQDILNRLIALEEGAKSSEPDYVRVYEFSGDRAADGVFEQFVQEYEQIVTQNFTSR